MKCNKFYVRLTEFCKTSALLVSYFISTETP